jgi:hypothetical protein
MKKGFDKGRSSLCREEEGGVQLLLQYSETKTRMEQFLSSKWLNINEGVSCRRINNELASVG